jgi:squalene-hopene/tetraprenyl-beta-curcumene cyclase
MSRVLALLVAVSFLVGCSRKADPSPHVEVPGRSFDPQAGELPPLPREVTELSDDSLARGVAYLLKHQSPDGAWRSDVYATFKDGTALTPLVLCALTEAAGAGVEPEGSAEARKKAAAWLAKFARPDGTIDPGPDGFEYPVYTAALAAKALSPREYADHHKARDAWVKFLKERQLTARLGWKPEDKEYGGWGYCRVIPKKPEPGQFAPPLIESNLSATVYALEALRAAGDKDAAVYEAAAVFVRRCQNADGGFHFVYDDPVRNKAGSPDPPGAKDARFHSYGSTTADGLYAISLCNLPTDADRRKSAVEWHKKHFRADAHPGEYVKAHESNRDAVYYYYAASVARNLRNLGVDKAGGVDWSAELPAALKKRQRDDGSWSNPVELVRENDPVVATAQAVLALSRCRK